MDRKTISSLITLRVVWVNSRSSMQWLMNISNVMNKQPHCSWKTILFSLICSAMVHYLLIFINILVTFFLVKPFHNVLNCNTSVVIVLSEIEFINILIIVNIWNVNKMPVTLKLSSFRLYVICKSSTFDKWIVLFFFCPIRIWLF